MSDYEHQRCGRKRQCESECNKLKDRVADLENRIAAADAVVDRMAGDRTYSMGEGIEDLRRIFGSGDN